MSNKPLSLRYLARHVADPIDLPISLRGTLGRPAEPVQLEAHAARISVVTQNMALLVAPGNYLGTDRHGAIVEICDRIRTLLPDVAGLCEVFSDGERDEIKERLHDLYPYFEEGPDEDDLESDGGLLLLSRYRPVASDECIYRECDGFDCFANKGMLYIRVTAPDWPTPVDFFYTHAQDIATNDGARVLYAQLSRMHTFISDHVDPRIPAIVMGDLNIPGELPEHYSATPGAAEGVPRLLDNRREASDRRTHARP